VPAGLRPGKRPPGAENARILGRLLSYLRRHGPYTPLLVRGESHCATPAVLAVLAQRRWADVVFGLTGTTGLRRLCRLQTALARASGGPPSTRTRLSEDFSSAAASWEHPWRGSGRAAGRAAGDTPRFVGPSCQAPSPPQGYADL
jgi:hypothetical protein